VGSGWVPCDVPSSSDGVLALLTFQMHYPFNLSIPFIYHQNIIVFIHNKAERKIECEGEKYKSRVGFLSHIKLFFFIVSFM
jgi:hypothetical protein